MPQTDPRFLVPAAGSYAPATPYNPSPEPAIYRPEQPTYTHPLHHEPETVDVHAHPHEEADENLSLINSERDLIRKALQRHGGKRKSAAQELGISERTLYRKIKEYGLEE
jgi:transcriptional regulator with PAS, ATPase and Fis domain